MRVSRVKAPNLKLPIVKGSTVKQIDKVTLSKFTPWLQRGSERRSRFCYVDFWCEYMCLCTDRHVVIYCLLIFFAVLSRLGISCKFTLFWVKFVPVKPCLCKHFDKFQVLAISVLSGSLDTFNQ